MKINLDIKGWDNSQDQDELIVTALQSMFEIFALQIGTPLEAIEEIWLVDKEGFGSTIQQIAPGTEYTNNEIYIAAAKTIPHFKSTNTSSMVIPMNYILLVLSHFIKQEPISDVNQAFMLDFNRYLIFHELGHCKDNFLRTVHIELNQISKQRFRIENTASHHLPIIAGEMAACIHSGITMTVDVFQYENKSVNETIVKILAELQDLKTSLIPVQEKVNEIGPKSSAVFWLILVQYAKLVSSQIGNEILAGMPIEFWEGSSNESQEILNDFFAQLWDIWDEYPQWTDTTFRFTVDLWHKLAMANGFHFKEGIESDGVWWG